MAAPESTAPGPTDGHRGPLTTGRVLVGVAAVAVVVYAADQGSKAWVEQTMRLGERIDVLGPLLRFQYALNPGAAFSLASGSTWIFSIIAAAVIVLTVWFARRIRSTAWAVLFGLLLGGTLGNLTDRLFRPPGFGVGHVVDFLRIPLLPAIFNIADVAIVSSMVLFVLLTLRGIRIDGTREPAAERRLRDARRDASAPAATAHDGGAASTGAAGERSTTHGSGSADIGSSGCDGGGGE